ncbi:YaiO family outer membrane beta-barrel protein [Polaromonas sp. YR568]|uniref:YaiO family outer membrane beta-barrel protein n=1 Tax=Polaromonas sp. YR568 TaxID=1855301 RepID=UPI00313784C1
MSRPRYWGHPAAIASATVMALTSASPAVRAQSTTEAAAETAAEPMAQTVAQAMPSSTVRAPDSVVVAPPVAAGDGEVRSLELTMGAQRLTAGLGNWREVALRGAYGIGPHLLQGEVSQHRRFNTDGTFLGLSDTYTFNEDWFGSVAIGVGDGAFFLPRWRADATLYRKLLADRRLVTSVGVGYYDAPDGHTDKSLSLGAAYYFEAPWVLEGGVRLNHSNPGGVRTQQQFVALTYGRDKQDLVTARYGWGSEGYLAIAANTQLVNFKSHEASLSWRHWFNPRTGALVALNRYTNPSYRRSGITVGVFHAF